jgi:hypothetical protein
MSGKPDQPRFSPVQIAVAGFCAALLLVVIMIAISL